jgi:hypothetical protein
MYGSKKNIRNSVLTEFRGHPRCTGYILPGVWSILGRLLEIKAVPGNVIFLI